MKIAILLFLISTYTSLSAQTRAKETSDYYLYTGVQRKLYNIQNSKTSLETKRADTYDAIRKFIIAHPTNEIGFSIIQGALILTALQVDTLINLVDPSLKRSRFRSSAEITLQRLQVAETGKPFPDLQLTDSIGNLVNVSSFRGNVILIDFWSSWCGPCRQQVPDLRKIYKKYHKKGLEIVGVSMDHDRAAWLRAIEKDKQNWKHYSELAPFSRNKMARTLSIYAIPSNFLLDKNGIIIGQDLSMSQIENMVEKSL